MIELWTDQIAERVATINQDRENLPEALSVWGQTRGLLDERWTWTQISREKLVPAPDQEAYRWGEVLLRYVASVGEKHYFAVSVHTGSQVYWAAAGLQGDRSTTRVRKRIFPPA